MTNDEKLVWLVFDESETVVAVHASEESAQAHVARLRALLLPGESDPYCGAMELLP